MKGRRGKTESNSRKDPSSPNNADFSRPHSATDPQSPAVPAQVHHNKLHLLPSRPQL